MSTPTTTTGISSSRKARLYFANSAIGRRFAHRSQQDLIALSHHYRKAADRDAQEIMKLQQRLRGWGLIDAVITLAKDVAVGALIGATVAKWIYGSVMRSWNAWELTLMAQNLPRLHTLAQAQQRAKIAATIYGNALAAGLDYSANRYFNGPQKGPLRNKLFEEMQKTLQDTAIDFVFESFLRMLSIGGSTLVRGGRSARHISEALVRAELRTISKQQITLTMQAWTKSGTIYKLAQHEAHALRNASYQGWKKAKRDIKTRKAAIGWCTRLVLPNHIENLIVVETEGLLAYQLSYQSNMLIFHRLQDYIRAFQSLSTSDGYVHRNGQCLIPAPNRHAAYRASAPSPAKLRRPGQFGARRMPKIPKKPTPVQRRSFWFPTETFRLK